MRNVPRTAAAATVHCGRRRLRIGATSRGLSFVPGTPIALSATPTDTSSAHLAGVVGRRQVRMLVDGRHAPDNLELTKALLISETLSPGSSRHDRITKRRAFQRNGVSDYWIVDGDAEVFEVWHPADERPA